jgi:hypothetical protein
MGCERIQGYFIVAGNPREESRFMGGRQKIFVARRGWAVFACGAVRGLGGSAGETRQVLIEATVVCPGLPGIP